MYTQSATVMSLEGMIEKITAVIEAINLDFADIKEAYEQALSILRCELGDQAVDKLLDAINRRCQVDLLFCGSLGYQANLSNFKDPIARTFVDANFEDYLRIGVLRKNPFRQAAQFDINTMLESFHKSRKELFNAISSYLLCLELDLTKIAHYAGFMWANELLEFTEPGYSPNDIISFRYQCFMEEWFGTSQEELLRALGIPHSQYRC